MDTGSSQLIVDGNNVMGTRPRTRWWADRPGATRRLAAELAALGVPLTVVFDGRALELEPAGGIEVRFAAGGGRNAADDLIVELVEALPDASSATVVTSDRGLRERVTALGARVEGAREFLRRHGLD